MLLDDRGATGPPEDEGAELTIRRRSVRRNIKGVAKRRFARFGYENVSLQDVANGADLDWDDFFQHYQDKSSLLTSVLDDGWRVLLPRIKHVASTALTAHTAILGILSLMTSTLHADEDLARLLFLEGRRVNLRGGELRFSTGYRRFMQIFRDLVARGQRDGSFRPALHPDVAASMLVGAFEGILRDRLVAGQERSVTAYTGHYVMPAFDALVSALKI